MCLMIDNLCIIVMGWFLLVLRNIFWYPNNSGPIRSVIRFSVYMAWEYVAPMSDQANIVHCSAFLWMLIAIYCPELWGWSGETGITYAGYHQLICSFVIVGGIGLISMQHAAEGSKVHAIRSWIIFVYIFTFDGNLELSPLLIQVPNKLISMS